MGGGPRGPPPSTAGPGSESLQAIDLGVAPGGDGRPGTENSGDSIRNSGRILATASVTQGHGECPLSARLRTPAGEAPVSAEGSAGVTRRTWKRSVTTGVWLDPRRARRWSDSWWLPLWGWALGVWTDCRVWRCAFACRRVDAVFRYAHLTRGAERSASIQWSMTDLPRPVWHGAALGGR